MIYLGNTPVGVGIHPSKVVAEMGTLTLEADTDNITVQTSLGRKPDFAAIWVKNLDSSKIQDGSCVRVGYTRNKYTDISFATPSYAQWSIYKHPTSGNFIIGQYNTSSDSSGTDSSFKFTRASYAWRALDTDGQPVVYEWYAMYIDD